MRNPCAVVVLFVATLVTILSSSVRADWSAWASVAGAYGYAEASCVPAGAATFCTDNSFGPLTAIASCTEWFPVAPPGAVCGVTANAAAYALTWTVRGGGNGFGGGVFAPGGVADQDTVAIEAIGERTTSTTFRIYGTSASLDNDFREIAVIRYTGEPSAFDSVAVKSVADLITQGFISPEDVLLHKTNSEIPSSFDFTGVDVTGLADGQILVWAAAHGTTDVPTAVDDPSVPAFALLSIVPNPFNPTTTIRFDVPRGGGNMSLRIFDVNGRTVKTLVIGRQSEGEKSVTWDGRDDAGRAVASGVYFCRLEASGHAVTRKMVLMK